VVETMPRCPTKIKKNIPDFILSSSSTALLPPLWQSRYAVWRSEPLVLAFPPFKAPIRPKAMVGCFLHASSGGESASPPRRLPDRR
jgi:hypothetical protein